MLPQCERQNYPTKTFMKPFKIFLLFWGIYLPERIRAKKCFRIGRRILLCLLMAVVLLSNVIVLRAYCYLYRQFPKSVNVMCIFIWLIQQALASYFIMRWTSKKSIKRILIQLRKANDEEGIKAHLLEHKICAALIIVFMILTISISMVSFVIFPNERKDMALGNPIIEKVLLVGT